MCRQFEGKRKKERKKMFYEAEIVEVPLESDCDDEKCACPDGICTFMWGRKKDKLAKYKDENGFYQCDKCSYKIDAEHNRRRRYNFRQHLESHQEKTIPCQECDKLFASNNLLKAHIKTVHRKNLSCDQCDFKTSLPKLLKQHKQQKHPNHQPNIKCRSCEKMFLTKQQATNHEKLSHGHKCVECDECGKMFVTSGQLNHHRKLMHKNNAVGCDLCDKTFKNEAYLRTHVKRVHSKTEHTPGTWTCPTCNSVVSSKSQKGLRSLMKRHLETHEPPKYNCDYCDKSFRDKGNYDGHINEHKGLTPYKCEPCNKSYASQGGLYQHYKRSAAHKD